MRAKLPALLAAALAVPLLIAALTTAVDVPGEEPAKRWLGVWPEPCGERPPRLGGAWRIERPLPLAIEEARAAAGGSRIYIGGARDGEERTLRLFLRYDTDTRSFTRLPALPAPRDHMGIAVAGDAVYAVGGYADGVDVGETAAAWRFAPATGRWERIAPLAHERGALTLVALDGVLYAIGGRAHDRSLTTVEAFDPATGRWQARAPLRVARDHHGGVVLGGLIYVVAGRQAGGGDIDSVEAYDPRTNRWTPRRAFPERRSGMGVVAAGGRLVVSGGETIAGDKTVSDRAFAYDPASDRWSALPALPVARHGHATAAVGARVYAFGGATCPGGGTGRTVASLDVSER